MFIILKLLVFYIWCCDGMRLGVQVMSACLVDVSVAGRVAKATGYWSDAFRCPLTPSFPGGLGGQANCKFFATQQMIVRVVERSLATQMHNFECQLSSCSIVCVYVY